MAHEKINMNSPGEKDIVASSIPAIYELTAIDGETAMENPMQGWFFRDWIKKAEEKKIRMELLLEAGVDVTAVSVNNETIFNYFCWYPFEEDYSELLDKMVEKGADLFFRDPNGNTYIYHKINNLASNTEAYLEYLISRGLHVTEKDLFKFAGLFPYMKGKKVTEAELRRLEKIKEILENDAKLTGLSYDKVLYDKAWELGDKYDKDVVNKVWALSGPSGGNKRITPDD